MGVMEAGIALSVGSTLLDLIGQSGEQQARQQDADYNERAARMAAADAVARGTTEAGYARMAGSRLAATQQVAFASGGVDATVGTPADTIGASRAMSEMDALTLANNAAREAWGFEEEAKHIKRQGKYGAQAASNKAAGTVLTSFGRTAAQVSGAQRRGADSDGGW
jgi:hypothetical protein